jgi:hypothetical protein
MTRVGAAVAAFFVAWFASYFIATRAIGDNRRVEFDANEKSGSLTEANVHWSIVHIRDDIGAIHNLIVMTNGLLAALLAVLLF